jgi:hypothetical protein
VVLVTPDLALLLALAVAAVLVAWLAGSPDRVAQPLRSAVRSGAGQGIRSGRDRWTAGAADRAARGDRVKAAVNGFSIPVGRRRSGAAAIPAATANGSGRKGRGRNIAPPASVTTPPTAPAERPRIPVGRGMNLLVDGVIASGRGIKRAALGAASDAKTGWTTARQTWSEARAEHERRRGNGEHTRVGWLIRSVWHRITGTVDPDAVERRHREIRATPEFQAWATHQGAVPQGVDHPRASDPDRKGFHRALAEWGAEDDRLSRELDPVLSGGEYRVSCGQCQLKGHPSRNPDEVRAWAAEHNRLAHGGVTIAQVAPAGRSRRKPRPSGPPPNRASGAAPAATPAWAAASAPPKPPPTPWPASGRRSA